MNAERFIELLDDAGCEPRSYSGRGMYGARCVSITTDRYQSEGYVAALTMIYAESDEQSELLSVWRGVRSDSMGLDTVIYFPDMDWPEGAAENSKKGEAEDE